MLFIFPMWDSENERLGLRECCPLSANLRGIAELGGFIGLFWLFSIVIFLIFKAIHGDFTNELFWMLLYPFVLGMINMLLYNIAYKIAHKKDYRYDLHSRETSWIEAGERKHFKIKY